MKWVTRERPKIDRIACPWLITRFIEQKPEFLYVSSDQVAEGRARRGRAIPYDVPDVELSHVGELCSFDAYCANTSLDEPGGAAGAGSDRARRRHRPARSRAAGGRAACTLARPVRPVARTTMRCCVRATDWWCTTALHAWLKEARDETHGWPPQAQAASRPDAAVNEASRRALRRAIRLRSRRCPGLGGRSAPEAHVGRRSGLS